MFILNSRVAVTHTITIFALSLLVLVSHADSYSNASRTAHFADLYLSAVSKDDASVVKALLIKGMSPDQKDSFGDPLLFMATRESALKILQVLLSAGANINVQNTNDYPFLIDVVVDKNKPVFDLLMAHKPDLSMENDSGYTVLDFASQIDQGGSTADTASILKSLQDANAPHGDRLKSIRSKDGVLVAHTTNFSADANTGLATITGTVTNLGKQHYSFVEIGAKFTDDTETLIDTGLDNVQSLDPGETWKFKITTLKDGATNYKLMTLTGRS